MKSKTDNKQNVELNQREREFIIANEGDWSVVAIARMSGIKEQTILYFLNTVGRDNCRRIRYVRKLKPVTWDEAVELGAIPKPKKSRFEAMWTDHTIAEVAQASGMTFPAAVYAARKKYHLPFSAKKLKEIKEHEERSKADRFKHHVEQEAPICGSWQLSKDGGYDKAFSGIMLNGKYIK